MNKNDLIESIAISAQISKVAAERGLNGLLSTMSAAMKDGKRVKTWLPQTIEFQP